MSLGFREVDLSVSYPQYQRLFSDAFPEKHGTSIAGKTHYGWKFLQQPGPAGPRAYGAFDEAEPVGFYGAIPLRYMIGNEAITAALICDVMTVSHMRGRGIFSKLGKCALDDMARSGIQLCTGYPIRAEVIPGHLKVGWKILFELPIYLKILRTREILQKWNCSWLAPPVDVCLRYYRRVVSRGQGSDDKVEWTQTDADVLLLRNDLGPFLEAWSGQIGNRLLRSVEMLRWRTSAPEVAVDAVIAQRANRIAGIALARRTQVKGVNLITVLDFMVHEGLDSVVPTLHEGLDELAVKEGSSGLALMTTPERAREWRLFENGYVRSGFAYKFIVRWLAGDEIPPIVCDRAAWHLTWLDTDCF